MALEPPTDSVGDVFAAGDEEEGLLTLSTIHSAKGLEWHSVFIIWAVEGKLPLRLQHGHGEERGRGGTASRSTWRRHAPREPLHVYPINIFDRALGMVLGKPSRFVEDLPEGLIKPVMLVEGE